MEVKIIKNHRISPLLYNKSYYKLLFAPAILGVLVSIFFFVKLVCAETSDNFEFSKGDFIVLGSSAFIFLTCMQFAATFLVSNTLVGIIESIINDNEFEHKPLSENK